MLTSRDMDILKWVYLFGSLSTSQIALLFDWHIKVCQRGLRKLIKEDYLRRIPLPTTNGRSPFLYYLGDKGASLLKVEASKPRLNRQFTHAMENADLLIQVGISFKSSEISCQILPEHIIRTSNHEKDLIPDGSFMLKSKEQEKQALFLIENDSSTEIVKSPTFNEDIENKIIKYLELFENNDIEFFENYFEAEFNRFRLLFISNNSKRLAAISKIVAEHDTYGFIWLTTLNNFNKKGITQDIWHVPGLNKNNLSILG